jgi:hypothetical protein
VIKEILKRVEYNDKIDDTLFDINNKIVVSGDDEIAIMAKSFEKSK